MNVDLVFHRQLYARDILVTGENWKSLYDFFQSGSKKYGIYFYTYNDDTVPFFAGKCTTKSFNILGRVWDELDDCDRGSGWLGKDISLIEECDHFSTGQEAKMNTWKRLTGKNMKNKIKVFLDNMKVTFAYLDNYNGNLLLDTILADIEVILQNRLIDKNVLCPDWVDEKALHDPVHGLDYKMNPVYKIESDFIEFDNFLFS